MSAHRPMLLRQQGAALLLLIALGGIGASVLLMSVFRPYSRDQQNEEQTSTRLAEAREALIGFAIQHGRLPRPASSALDGTERESPCETEQSCSGFIPWVTLGIDGSDSWGKLLRYSVTPAFTVVPIRATTVGGDKTIISRDGLGKSFYLVGQPGCPIYAQCPSAVLYSSGKNNPGTSVLGMRLLSLSENNIDERHNDIAANNFISRMRSTNPDTAGGEFDDLVTWLPTSTLYARMRAANVLR